MDDKGYHRFLLIADGSLTEVEACLELCLDLNLINKNEFDRTENTRRELASTLISFFAPLRLVSLCLFLLTVVSRYSNLRP